MFFSKKNKEVFAEKPVRTPVDVKDLHEIESKKELSVGTEVVHKTLGKGTITGVEMNTVRVDFKEYEPKDLLIDICLENRLLYNEAEG